MPLMRELAELLISKEFGVPTDSEFWQSIRNARELPPECVTPIAEQA